MDRGAINKTQEAGGIAHHVEKLARFGFESKKSCGAFRAVDILPEGELSLVVASFFGGSGCLWILSRSCLMILQGLAGKTKSDIVRCFRMTGDEYVWTSS